MCRVGEGELQENFKKDVLFYERTQILQGLLPMIVGYTFGFKNLFHTQAAYSRQRVQILCLLFFSLRLSTILEPLDEASIQVIILKPDSI